MSEQPSGDKMAKRAPKLKIRSLRLQNFSGPLHRRIYFALREQILRGDFQNDERLPSSRILAKSLGLSRNTILAAYDRLADHGYAVARIGSGTRVRRESARLKYAAVRQAVPAQIRGKLADVFKQARYPLRHARFHDRDGNSLYVYDPRQAA